MGFDAPERERLHARDARDAIYRLSPYTTKHPKMTPQDPDPSLVYRLSQSGSTGFAAKLAAAESAARADRDLEPGQAVPFQICRRRMPVTASLAALIAWLHGAVAGQLRAARAWRQDSKHHRTRIKASKRDRRAAKAEAMKRYRAKLRGHKKGPGG
jgi:hypothetical protein